MTTKNHKKSKNKKEAQLKKESNDQQIKSEEIASVEEENTTEEVNEPTDEIEEEVTDEEVEKEEEEISKPSISDDYRDKLVRKIAEFENYKKRTSEEFIRLISTANEDLILKLLPILDDIERFHKNYNDDMKAEDLKKGIDLITSKFATVISTIGLKAVDSIGKEFDPNFHDALLQMENPDIESNHIIDEHEKGYTLNDKVIRHAKVIVSK